MRALVTGVAGFIGSNLADELIARGHAVRGVDCFTPYYDESSKRGNLVGLNAQPGFDFHETDLRTTSLPELLDGVDVVFHQAAQPGVRLSWSDGFAEYTAQNIDMTQRLLEAARHAQVERFVYASSSSVYGNAAAYPTRETDPLRPFSPYGVTKLAGELLCNAYAANFGVHTVSLRYFTVYGPRQRPDMATHRLIQAARHGTPFPLFGDGSQVRDFTYVGDIVAANIAAAAADVEPGTVANIAGGGSTTLLELVHLVSRLVGHDVPIDWRPAQPGDVQQTGGSTEHAERLLGWIPAVSLEAGVAQQVQWHLNHLP